MEFARKRNVIEVFRNAEDNEDDFLLAIYEQTQLKTKSDYSSFGQSLAQDLLIMKQIKSWSCTVSEIDTEKNNQHLVLS